MAWPRNRLVVQGRQQGVRRDVGTTQSLYRGHCIGERYGALGREDMKLPVTDGASPPSV